MEKKKDRRSGSDRRKQTGISLRLLIGSGNRRDIRRKDDQRRIFFVDWYGSALFLTILVILFLCVIDALLTLFLLKHGAYETNPIMAYMLKVGPYAFVITKYAMTIFATFSLLILRNVVIRKLNINANSLLYAFAWIYVGVVAWELYLMYYVI